jgi:hypothetical protein
MNKRQTNEEFVVDLMNYSKYGGLVQAFVIEALRYYSEQIAESVPKEDSKSFIDPIVWHGIAVDVLDQLKERYEKV